MSTRLDDLLDGASPDPATAPDVEQLWVAGRRRRRWQQAGAALGVVALLGVAGGVAANLDTFRTPQVDPVAAPDQPVDDDVDDVPDSAGGDDAAPDDDLEHLDLRDRKSDAQAADEEADDEEADDAEPTPSPEPAAMEAPCDAHQDRRGEAFIALVAPVEGQVVSGELELVGCASVYEGTVQYRLRDADGGVLVEDFTTASAGGPELGDFRDTVDVSASGELTLEVFWQSPADGSEADKTTVTVRAE